MKYPSQSEVTKAIGKRVAEVRKKHKLSQADLCYEADIDLSTLSRLERGVLNPSLSTFYRLAKTLDVPIKTFFDF